MTPDKINQLRQLLKKTITCSAFPGTVIMEAEIYHQILALLPCPTCNGAGKIIVSGCYDMVYKEIDCPDCPNLS